MIVVCVGKSAGKTTVAVNLAVCLALAGLNVLLLDADPQGTASEIAAHRTRPAIYTTRIWDTPDIHSKIGTLAAGYDVVIIDAPAGAGVRRGHKKNTVIELPLDDRMKVTRSAIAAALGDEAGIVLVPAQPTQLDAWAGDAVFWVIEQIGHRAAVHVGGVHRRSLLLLVRVDGRSSTVLAATRDLLTRMSLRLADTVIHQRTAYVVSFAQGLGVVESAPRSPAAGEIRALARELCAIVGQPLPETETP